MKKNTHTHIKKKKTKICYYFSILFTAFKFKVNVDAAK